MSYRRTLVFFVIFVALAASYYFYEFKGKASREESEKKVKLLLSFKIEDAETLILKRPGETIAAEKDGERWTITQPIATAADQRTIEQVLRELAELTYERELGAQADLQAFGLSEPEMEIEIKGTSGIIGNLLLGAFTPDENNVYVKASGDQKVYTAARSAKSSISKSLFDLRDKSVFDFAVPDVKELTVSLNGKTISFESLPDGDWKITAPEKHPADAEKVRSLLDSIKYTRIQKFAEEEAADLQKYGLSSPRARLELTLTDKKKTLLLGKEAPGGLSTVYARRDNERRVFELRADILKELSGNIKDWQAKQTDQPDSSK